MASSRKVIITCAVTGSIHTPSMSPHLPVTPDEIAAAAVGAAEAGATVLQLAAHAFQAGFGLQKSNSELKKQFIATGAVQLNGEKLSDANATVTPAAGDILRLSKKHSVRIT